MKNGKKKFNLEITVEEAAQRLQVSTRTIVNYIKSKSIKAIKVGKKWFVDEPSVVAFSQKTGITYHNNTQANIVKSQAPAFAKKKSPYALAAFRLCIEAFNMPMWQQISSSSLDNVIMKTIFENKIKVLECLGSGFYCWGGAKAAHYMKAKSYMGAILGILYSSDEYFEKWKKEIEFIEINVMPAFSSLIKKIEKDSKK